MSSIVLYAFSMYITVCVAKYVCLLQTSTVHTVSTVHLLYVLYVLYVPYVLCVLYVWVF